MIATFHAQSDAKTVEEWSNYLTAWGFSKFYVFVKLPTFNDYTKKMASRINAVNHLKTLPSMIQEVNNKLEEVVNNFQQRKYGDALIIIRTIIEMIEVKILGDNSLQDDEGRAFREHLAVSSPHIIKNRKLIIGRNLLTVDTSILPQKMEVLA